MKRHTILHGLFAKDKCHVLVFACKAGLYLFLAFVITLNTKVIDGFSNATTIVSTREPNFQIPVANLQCIESPVHNF